MGAGGRARQHGLVERSHQATEGGRRSEPGDRAERRPRGRRRARDRRDDAARRGGAPSCREGKVRAAGARRGAGRLAADSQSGDDRRQRVAGHALLVLPRRLDLLSRRRQHLLRRHADGGQPRARDLRRRPLRRREPVRHRAGARRARRDDGDPRAEGRADGRGRRLLDRPGDRHHAHERAGAKRAAGRDSHSGDDGGGAVLFREGAGPAGVGLPAGERGGGDQTEWREHRRVADRGERGGGDAKAAEKRRSVHRGQAAQ